MDVDSDAGTIQISKGKNRLEKTKKKTENEAGLRW